MASVYAAAIHSRAELDMPRSRWMEGAATFTIVESSRFMIIAARTTAKPVQACFGVLGSMTAGRSSYAGQIDGGRHEFSLISLSDTSDVTRQSGTFLSA